MKRIFHLFMAVLLLMGISLLAAGCGTAQVSDGGQKASDSQQASESQQGSGSQDATGAKEKYIVGTDAAYAPFEYVNEKGEIVGLDIEFVKALAEVQGFEVEFKHTGWDPLFAGALDNGEVDFAVSAITITKERKESFDFSDPYFVANQLILVPQNSNVEKLEDLKDKTVGVQNGTTGHEVVKKLLGETSPQIKAYETTPFAIQDLVNGVVEAVVADNAVVLEYLKQNPNVKLKYVEDPSFEKEYYGLMVKKGNTELLNKLNEGIKKLKESGKLKEIFGQDLEEKQS